MALTENQRKWVEALRSGEYKQTKGNLGDENGYCCLGVACEIARASGISVGREVVDGEIWYDSHSTALPPAVMRWLGLRTAFGAYGQGVDAALDGDNDRGATFEEIAATIEAEPDGLFVEAE